MIIIFLIFGLILLVSGGIGIFYINVADNVASGTPLFFLGNLGFGTFIALGIFVIIFLAFFNAEFD